jgi:hypothetical protein
VVLQIAKESQIIAQVEKEREERQFLQRKESLMKDKEVNRQLILEKQRTRERAKQEKVALAIYFKADAARLQQEEMEKATLKVRSAAPPMPVVIS